jgi:cytochrome c biogenesis protein CcdA
MALSTVARESGWATPVVFLAGVISSLGPCASPRLVALSALAVRARRPWLVGLAFILGTLGTYATLGVAGSLVADLVGIATWVYGGIAVAGIVGGIVTIAGAGWHSHEEPPVDTRRDAVSAALLAGMGFALMVSPCCTPILGVIIGYTSLRGDVVYGCAMLVVFGLGHAAPLIAMLGGGRGLTERLWSSRFAQSAQVFAGTFMLGLGAYYALLV